MFLDSKYINSIKKICEGIKERYYVEFETIGFDENHIHLMICSVLSYSPSKIFQIVKSITAIKLFKEHPDLKKELWGENFGVMRVL